MAMLLRSDAEEQPRLVEKAKGAAAQQDVDFALGGLSIFRFRFLFIDFIYPYMEDVFAFVAKAAVRIPLTQAILSPFQLEVWLALMLSLLLAWTGLVVLRRCTPRDKLVGTEPDAWFLMSTLIRQGELKCEYRTLSFRVLLAAWLLLSLVASSSYSCLLLSFMTVPTYSPPVDTAQRLQAALKSGEYGAGTAKATAQHTLIEAPSSGIFLLREGVMREGVIEDDSASSTKQVKASGILRPTMVDETTI
ncbi:glutamate receptor ionotropic, delta-2-like [Haemaphysalis longicornis]